MTKGRPKPYRKRKRFRRKSIFQLNHRGQGYASTGQGKLPGYGGDGAAPITALNIMEIFDLIHLKQSFKRIKK